MKDLNFDEWMESQPRAKFRPILYPNLSETEVGKWWDSRTPVERHKALKDFAWSEETLKVENGPYSISWDNHTADTRRYLVEEARRGTFSLGNSSM
jgi:hypothetical protein